MVLDPLATVTDLSARCGDNIPDGDYETALRVASSSIREAAESTISAATSTVTTEAPGGNLLGLPGPITAVTSVSIDGCAVTDYRTFGNGLYRSCGWSNCYEPVTVTYSHGLTTVPEDIIDLTCHLALAWLDHAADGGGSTAGLIQASIDDASEQYNAESAEQVSPVYIPEETRSWLARRFGGGTAVVETV